MKNIDIIKKFKIRLIKTNKSGTLFYNSFLETQNSIDLNDILKVLNLKEDILKMFLKRNIKIDFSDLNLKDIDNKILELVNEHRSQTIEELSFNITTVKLLHENKIFTVEELIQTEEAKIRNFISSNTKKIEDIINTRNEIINFLKSDDKKKEIIKIKTKKSNNLLSRFKKIDKKSRLQIEQKNIKGLGIGYPYITGKLSSGKEEIFRAPLYIWDIDISLVGSNLEIKIGDPVLNNSILSIIATSNNIEYDFRELEDNNSILTNDYIENLIKSISVNKFKNPYNDSLLHSSLEKPRKNSNSKKIDYEDSTITLNNIISFGMYDVASSSILGAYNIIEEKGDLEFINDLVKTEYDWLSNVKNEYKDENIKLISYLDNSQKIAVANSIKKSSYIWGPPGTGKSQAITNILANLIYSKNKTLFITEKQVASEVVYDRMGKLNNFALKLYAKENNQSFHTKIKATVNIVANYIRGSSSEFNRIKASRDSQSDLIKNIETIFEEIKSYKNFISMQQSLKYLNIVKTINIKENQVLIDRYLNCSLKYAKKLFDIIDKSLNNLSGVDLAKEMFTFLCYINNNFNNDSEYFKYREKFFIFKKDNQLFNFIEDLSVVNEKELKNYKNSFLDVLKYEKFFENFTEIETIMHFLSEFKPEDLNLYFDLITSHKDMEKNNSIFKFIEHINDNFENIIDESYIDLLKQNKMIKNSKLLYNRINNKVDTYKIKLSQYFKFKKWKKGSLNFLNQFSLLITNANQTKKILRLITEPKNKKIFFQLNDFEFFNITKITYETLNSYSDENINTQKIIFNQLKSNNIYFNIYQDFLTLEDIKKIYLILSEIDSENNFIDSNLFKDFIRNIKDNQELYQFYSEDLNYKKINHIWALIYERVNENQIKIIKDTYMEKMLNYYQKISEGGENEIFFEHLENIKNKLLYPNSNPYSTMFRQLIKKIDSVKVTVRKSTYFKNYLPILKIIFPIFISSPEEISNNSVIPLNKAEFDFAIFDEASQIFTEKAIPVMYRSKKFIVSGDDKQLPPTSFFKAKNYDDYDLLEENVENHEEGEIVDALQNESLLDFSKPRFENFMLKYHYRSKFKELINFSNKKFYNNELVVVDQPENYKLPIEVFFVSGVWENQKNIVEANKVISVILDLINNKYSNLIGKSIGVITFNQKQQELIENKLEEIAYNNEKLAQLINPKNSDEYLFIKNIENVQGDERDIIIFSIGFAMDTNGVFSNRFGPIGQNGGERRLNVAISRAKEKMIVIKSINSNIITTKHPSSTLFKEFLEYVERLQNIDNSLDLSNVINYKNEKITNIFLNDVFEEISRNLPDHYSVIKNLKVDKHEINLVIKNNLSNEYCLGIMLDEFEKFLNEEEIREQFNFFNFLKVRGWEIKRIVSTNWYSSINNKNRSIIIDKILEILQKM
ncbi:AAA domain-containing protein [Spiroplasma endosymbiont of Cantharis nigra]|uniref:AAA domain-containing protein n=1 Tax=Spiroplasma endosymbiont of Cantharis nigra TaxID=3066278 RepID=UPI0030D2D740